MLSAVILTLDAAATGEVRRLRRVLADQRIDDGLKHLDVEPHLTLAVYEGMDAADLLPAVETFAPRAAAPLIHFSSLGIFPGPEAILFLAPKVSAPLLDLQAEYHRAAVGQSPYLHGHFAPERWVPHCTLAAGLGPADLPRAVAAVQSAWSPFAASLSTLTLVTFPPVVRLFRHVVAPPME